MYPKNLEPRLDHLNQEYVLVQAWKKTAEYIRYHNWFADTLELDYTTINLRAFLDNLRERLNSPDDWISDGLHLIPAPKSQQWKISNGSEWKPEHHTNVPLRPLAHVSLRDQVMATALMLCLADRVETQQGDPCESIEDAKGRNKINSYGNRLFCKNFGGMLRHSWGTQTLYRSYFEDYRVFVSRPTRVAKSISRYGKRKYIVESDLTQFYDKIRPKHLADALARFQCSEDEVPFFQFAKKVLNWGWSDADDEADFAKITKLSKGARIALPQGLVSAGFFANAVLIGFDEKIRSQIGQDVRPGICLEDACRYVDDLRFVVTVKQETSDLDIDRIEESMTSWIGDLLKREAPSLVVSKDKTKAIEYSSTESRLIPYSARMNRVQSAISGGFDAVGGLDILDTVQGLMREQQALNSDPNKSVWQYSPLPDVRNETALRFSATRYRKVFRSVRPLLQGYETSISKAEGAESIATDRTQSELDEEARTFSLSLIERWVEDPSNVRLLRIGFDIWPDPKVLKDVIELMAPWIKNSSSSAEKQVVWYCLSELLRAGATETGFVGDDECLPKDAHLGQYQDYLGKAARRLLQLGGTIPWYVQQQAWLYLIAHDVASCPASSDPSDHELVHYHQVASFFQGKSSNLRSTEFAIVAVLARRAFKTGVVAVELARPMLTDRRKKEIGLRDPAFVLELGDGDERFFDGLPSYIRSSLCQSPRKPSKGYKNLVDVVLASKWKDRYRLRNELSLLRFSLAFLKEIKPKDANALQVIAPDQIQLSLEDDGDIFDVPRLKIIPRRSGSTPYLYDVPGWCCPSEYWRFSLGFVLRFILSMRQDFTSVTYPWYAQEPPALYRPVRSGWYQRTYGAFNSHAGFGDDLLPVSDWTDGLLLSLLRWPGVQLPNDFCWVDAGIDRAVGELENRIAVLERMRGFPHRTLLMPMVTAPKAPRDVPFRACVVQTVIPTASELQVDPMVSTPDLRKRHRGHLSAALEAVKRMLTLRGTHSKAGARLDWLILPELSVHPDDVKTHLIPFAQTYQTLILAGLTYQKSSFDLPVVNSAVWIMPERSEEHGSHVKVRRQGKRYHAEADKKLLESFPGSDEGVRPCQWLVEYVWSEQEAPLRLTGSVCYDATDLELAAELRKETDVFAIPAFNKDVNTFDQLALALHYHMYQMIIVANNGQYGGSNAYWPCHGEHVKQLFHLHGQPQATMAFLEIENVAEFLARSRESKKWKRPPAGF